jgi:hypothetical protein
MKGGFVSKNGYTYTYGYIAIRVRAIGLDVHFGLFVTDTRLIKN